VKPNKQVIIDFIVSCLKKGEQRGNILVKVGKKWGTSKSAFDRLLKNAKEQHTAQQQALNDKLAAVDAQEAIEARKKAIMTANERKEYLTRIILGEIKVPYKEVKWDRVKEEFVTIDFVELAGHSARISAIAELNKMEGAYAPTKVAQTDTEGNDVPAQALTEDQFSLLLKSLREGIKTS
jgi:hypothetical protein